MSNLQKILCVIILTGIFLLLSTSVLADNSIKVVVDDKVLEMDVPPTIVDDRTLVPLRVIFEALGAEVQWDDSTETVTAKKGDSVIILKINDRFPTLNGVKQEMDVPAMVLNDRTMVPVRFIANSLGTYVEWNEDSQTVTVITPQIITFSDKNLEKIIRDKVGIPTGDLKNTDVRKIDTLDAKNADIENIDGIENLVSLINFDLSSNNIKNIKKLESLKALKELKLQFNPLDNLSPLTMLSNDTKIYLLDNKNPVKDVKSSTLNEYEQVIKKAAEITSTIIKSEMSDLEKELAIHDYLALNTKYDYQSLVNIESSDNCHSAYGALIDGKAVCDGYAKAMEIMLNMVDVECMTVTGYSFSYQGRPNGHAWNIVKIDGNYYHTDVSSDDLDGDNAELIHVYTNISDKQASSSFNWDKDNYPKCLIDNEDYNNLLNMIRTTIYTDDAIYKAVPNLYRIDPKTSEATLLTSDKASQIQIYGDWIYYINDSKQQNIYKIKTDGTENTKVNDKSCVHMLISGKRIFYISNEDSQLYKIDIDDKSQSSKLIGSGDVTTNIFALGEWVFYRTFTWDVESGIIKKVSNNFTSSQVVVSDTPAGYTVSTKADNSKTLNSSYGVYERVSGNYLYYISAASNSLYKNTLYRVRLDGQEKRQISKDHIDSLFFEIFGDYIYYQNSKDDNKTYRIKLDGSERICLQ